MPPAKTDGCGWKDCENEGTNEIHLDAGSTTCKECGTEITDRRLYRLCDDHKADYQGSGDVTLLLLFAKEA